MSKTKTDSNSDRGGDTDKLIQDDKSSTANVSNVEDITLPTSLKDATTSKYTTTGPLHNHMNTNMFSSHDSGKGFVAPKTQILVEIDGSKQAGYSPSPLIFTTAKIHTDGKTKHMEPVQVTPVPILSTIEVSLLKSGSIKGESSGLVNSNISAVYSTIPKSNINVTEKDNKISFKQAENTPIPPYIVGTKVLISGDKTAVSSELAKNSTSSLASKDLTTNQSKLNSGTSKKDNTMEKDALQSKVPVTLPTTKATILDETKKSVAKSEPTKFAGTVNPQPHTINNTSKSGGVVNQAVTAAQTKTDDFKNIEKKNESNNNPTAFASAKTQVSENVNKMPDKSSLNSTTSTNSRQLQRQSIVLDSDEPNLKLEPHINSCAPKNSKVGSQKSEESQKPNSVSKSVTQSKPAGNDSFNLSDKTVLPKISANNIPASSVSAVPVSTAGNSNKTAASKSTPAPVHKSTAPVSTTVAANKTSTSIVNSAPIKNPPTADSKPLAANISSTPITTTASKLPSPIANTTTAKKSPVNTTTTIGDNKIVTTTISAVSANKTKTTDTNKSSSLGTTVAKKVPTSIPISPVKPITTSNIPTSSNQINSKSTVLTTTSKEPSTNIKNNVAGSGSAVKSGIPSLNSTTKAPVTCTASVKSTPSTSNTKTKVSTNTAVQANASTAIKSPTVIKSPTAVTTKPVTQSKTVSKLDNTKDNLTSSGGKSSTSKINTTVTPGITNVTTSTTATAIDSSVSSSKAAPSNKKSDTKSNELSNGSKIFKA